MDELIDAAAPAPSWITRFAQLERQGQSDTYVARGSASPQGRLFGGLVAAQALRAACATVAGDKLAQSLHLYFVRAGRPDVDITYEVERTRIGRSFDTRRVTALQDGEVILEMLGSFHRPEPGVDLHPPAPPMVSLADAVPLDVPLDLADLFEIRVAAAETSGFTGPPYWIRSRKPTEGDPASRACALAYMSDIALMAAARPPGATITFGSFVAASLDHSIWFHRPFHPERWHRYQAGSVNNNDSRGLALGAFHDEDGTLIASIAQEALWRA